MLHKLYLSEIYRSLEYLPTWLPTDELRLGDILTADSSTVRRVGHISDYGWTFAPRDAPARATLQYLSKSSVSINTKVAGRLLPGSMLTKADVGLLVKFTRPNAIAFEASGCVSTNITDLSRLASKVLQLYRDGTWPRGQIIVTEMVKASSATIIISSGETAHIDLKANADLGQTTFGLSDLHARFETKSIGNIGFRVIATRGLTPLYRACGIRHSWVGRPDFRGRFRSGDDFEDNSFGSITPQELFR